MTILRLLENRAPLLNTLNSGLCLVSSERQSHHVAQLCRRHHSPRVATGLWRHLWSDDTRRGGTGPGRRFGSAHRNQRGVYQQCAACSARRKASRSDIAKDGRSVNLFLLFQVHLFMTK